MDITMRQVLTTPARHFADHVLRGVGQVMLQDNPITGLLFLVGIFINDWVSGLYALLGTVISTGTAILLRASPDKVRRGLYGFNGTLVGLSLAFQQRHEAILLVYIVLASIFVTIVTAAIMHIFGSRGHALTGPFVITTWIFIGSLFTYGRLSGETARAALHSPVGLAQAITLSPADAMIGILNGPAQVMLQQNVWTGAIFLVALAVNSRISCAAAVLGSAVGVAVAWWLQGAAPSAIREGLYGFNAVLTGIALGGGLYFLLHRTTVLLAILAACVSTILYGSLVVVLKPLGLPVLTAPFVLTTWLCLLAGSAFPRLQALSVVKAATPERDLSIAKRSVTEKK